MNGHKVSDPQPFEVHLWLAVADRPGVDPSRQERWATWLSDDERARWQRFRFARDRDRFLLARGLLRSTLSRYRPQRAPGDWRLCLNERGRPFLAEEQQGRKPLYFNLSHTKGLVALAVAVGPEVGVDVEPIDRSGPHLKMAEHFFAPSEASALRALAGPDAHQNRFLELWCLKESYIKARGLGLAVPLDSFAFTLDASEGVALRTWPHAGDSATGWSFALLRCGPSHRLAVALRQGRDCPETLSLTLIDGDGDCPGPGPLSLERSSCDAVRLTTSP